MTKRHAAPMVFATQRRGLDERRHRLSCAAPSSRGAGSRQGGHRAEGRADLRSRRAASCLAGDVAICNDRIVGTLGDYRGVREIDVRGKIVVPGFIDTHCHVESSLITPLEFDRCVLAHGVTTAICDPHEIGNVLGVGGPALFPRRRDGDRDGPARAAFELRARDRSRDRRRPARGRRPSRARRPSEGARASPSS